MSELRSKHRHQHPPHRPGPPARPRAEHLTGSGRFCSFLSFSMSTRTQGNTQIILASGISWQIPTTWWPSSVGNWGQGTISDFDRSDQLFYYCACRSFTLPLGGWEQIEGVNTLNNLCLQRESADRSNDLNVIAELRTSIVTSIRTRLVKKCRQIKEFRSVPS